MFFSRLEERIRECEGATDRIVYAAGEKMLTLGIQSLAATLAVVEVFLDDHWRKTDTMAFVQGIGLAGHSQRLLRYYISELISTNLFWVDLASAWFLEYLRKIPVAYVWKGCRPI